ncbi:hypothetical protein [Psychrobacter pygoscelis]|nr:hypothetical protein [Psychrobacter pygoscelis]
MRPDLFAPILILYAACNLTGCQVIQTFDHPIPVTTDYNHNPEATIASQK